MIVDGMKRCGKCGEWKPIEEFSKNIREKDGLAYKCKSCFKKYYVEHSNYFKDYEKKYYKFNIIEIKNKRLIYYNEHSDEIKENQLNYREMHKDEIRESRKERDKRYNSTPDGKSRKARNNHKRRIFSFDLKNDLSSRGFIEIIKMQSNICPICEECFTESDPPTRDHIIPLTSSNGFKNLFCPGLTKGNVQAVHKKCNSSKNNKWDISIALNNVFDI